MAQLRDVGPARNLKKLREGSRLPNRRCSQQRLRISISISPLYSRSLAGAAMAPAKLSVWLSSNRSPRLQRDTLNTIAYYSNKKRAGTHCMPGTLSASLDSTVCKFRRGCSRISTNAWPAYLPVNSRTAPRPLA